VITAMRGDGLMHCGVCPLKSEEAIVPAP
jgi:hypothetical protein